MEAVSLATAGRPSRAKLRGHGDRPRFDAAWLLAFMAGWLALALVVCSGFLLLRRLAGGSIETLSGGAIFGVGCAAIVWAALARLLARYANETSLSAATHRSLNWLPTIGLAFVGAWATATGDSVGAAVLVWGLIAAEESGDAWLRRRWNRASRSIGRTRRAPRAEVSIPGGRTCEADVWQQQTRERVADGREWIHGTVRAAFAAEQRTAIEHLVFCPLLSGVPQVTAAAVDELDCTVRATHVYRYGARLEIRLREPCHEPVQVLVRYEARG